MRLLASTHRGARARHEGDAEENQRGGDARAARRRSGVDVSMLTYAHVCSRMLTYAHACLRMFTYAHVCWRMLTYAYVCSRILTYAHGISNRRYSNI
jgi:hypothetical protein